MKTGLKKSVFPWLRVFFIVALFSGCAATQQQQQPPVEKRVRAYRAPYMAVFKAAVDYCHESGFTLQAADPSMGVITTDYHADDSVSAQLFGDRRPKIDLTIRPLRRDSLVAIAAVLAFMEKREAFFGDNKEKSPIPSFTTEQFYQKIFEGIERRLGARREE